MINQVNQCLATPKHQLLLVVLFILIVSSCKGPAALLQPDTNDFRPSSIQKSVFLDSINTRYPKSVDFCFEGKARLTVRTPEQNDKGITDFKICRDAAYYRLKNRLGIEAIRIWQKQDSLFIWDLIEKTAYRLRQSELSDPRINALAAVDLYALLLPELSSNTFALYEDEGHYMMLKNNKESFIFDKTSFDLVGVKRPTSVNIFDTIGLGRYASKNDLVFPTQIELLNSSTETNIFILLQQLVSMQEAPDLDHQIPASVPFYQ